MLPLKNFLLPHIDRTVNVESFVVPFSIPCSSKFKLETSVRQGRTKYFEPNFCRFLGRLPEKIWRVYRSPSMILKGKSC